MKNYEITTETPPTELQQAKRELGIALALDTLTPREKEYAQRKLAHAAFEQAQRALDES